MENNCYPRLKASVRIKNTTHYTIIKDLFVDKPSYATPADGLILSLCCGALTPGSIANIVAKVYKTRREVAEKTVNTVLESLGRYLEFLPVEDYRPTGYDMKDFMYKCSPVPESGKLLKPFSVSLMLTHSCDYRCIYCYNSSSSDIPHEMDTESWLALIDELADTTDCFVANLTGGEPMSHPGFFRILEHLYKREIYTDISTNGSLIDDEAIERFVSIGQKRLLISLDSADPAMHHYMTGSSNTFDRVVTAIKKLVAAGIRVECKSIVTPLNMDGIEKLSTMLADIGVEGQVYDNYQLDYRGRGLDRKLRLTMEQQEQVRCVVEELMIKRPEFFIRFDTGLLCWESTDSCFRCGGLSDGLIVMSDGTITFCEKLGGKDEYTLGRFPNDRIMDVWNSPKVDKIINPPLDAYSEVCRACEQFENCKSGCFASKLIAGQEMYAVDPCCPKAPDSIFRRLGV